ncbi:MAG: hypothetical protein ABF289_09270 [Clostridiales bacterium]
MQIKKIAKNSMCTSFKILWASLCYMIAGFLAIVSAYFTIIFYSDGSKGTDIYIMAFLAISLEAIKLIFAIGYPHIKNRDKKVEETILLTLKICFILSVLSSMYYLLLGSNIQKSPASRTVTMIYSYLPFIDIIPITIMQFLATVSLTVLVEFFIIFLPTVAPVIFYEKNYSRKVIALTNFEKLKEIVIIIPDMIIDKLYKRVMKYSNINENNESPKIIELNKSQKPKLKLLKRLDLVEVNKNSNIDREKHKENIFSSNQDKKPVVKYTPSQEKITDKNNVNPFLDNIIEDKTYKNPSLESDSKNLNLDQELFLNAIYKLQKNNICPSVKDLEIETGLTKNSINNLKRFFEELQIIRTDKNKTVILCNLNQAIITLGNS